MRDREDKMELQAGMTMLRLPIYVILSLAMVVTVTACTKGSGQQKRAGNRDVNEWRITDLRADHGHDTLESEEGGMFHNYFCAVVLEQDNQTVNLLYENELPENVELKIGDRCYIDGLDSAKYSETWRGYWLRDVKLRPVGSD